MNHTHSLSEWAAFVSLGVSGYAALSAPYFVFVDADLKDFDPRPALARIRLAVWDAVRSDAAYPLLREWSNTKCDVREIPADVREFVSDARLYARLSLRDTAFTATALLMLLTTSPKGALR
ncbi:hypothetical protein [Streptomyces sp. NBC_01373]|uniref:hypothetical protein n=1 Tax=Streptomyces sp. NBC_01373 TaxID=2903843 RepID=UPI00224F1106|nr:hypothetical protein [Streptomyces sp. NBC_01373]MCX4703930.1 hypothetical protein [Streptomyces sp. NBC_01373]